MLEVGAAGATSTVRNFAFTGPQGVKIGQLLYNGLSNSVYIIVFMIPCENQTTTVFFFEMLIMHMSDIHFLIPITAGFINPLVSSVILPHLQICVSKILYFVSTFLYRYCNIPVKYIQPSPPFSTTVPSHLKGQGCQSSSPTHWPSPTSLPTFNDQIQQR